ncbi:MAG TPA: metal ABC transporter substrate-binding protein [Nonomuraea sp.]|nr:metal ABC transporter substrate-binding protein [Nonomuraea sp.]
MRVPTSQKALVLTVGLLATGCSAADSADSADRPAVLASIYPLEWVTEQVAGDRVRVEGLTPPGAEPHDLELGTRQVASLSEADLIVYLDGFQPALDDAIVQEASDSALDVSSAARLLPLAGTLDPHFWLDPLRLADVAEAIAGRLAKVDPNGTARYRAGAAQTRRTLEALDAELAEGLAGCAGTELVTSHEAFGYLADRYGMSQVGISGLSPDAEPAPRQVAEVSDLVRTNGVRTIYYETLVSPDVARTIARETGASTAVLDPIEGLTDTSRGEDYLAVMRSNLATLQEGQPCR